MKGYIFKIQRYSIHDGPGIRTTVFFQGCPLSCLWCHNPESRPVFFPHLTDNTLLPPNPNDNDSLNSTVTDASIDAIETMSGSSFRAEKFKLHNKISKIRKVRPDELAAEMEKDCIFFDRSEGGVTCSGGEPLFQHEFLIGFLKQLKEREIHTAVDTSGFAPVQAMAETSDIADLILFDVKLINNDDHIKYTGVPVKCIHENLKMLHEKNIKVWLRFPLIPQITETDENIDKITDFLLLFKKFRHINILPFHKTGEGKYLKLGIKNPMEKAEPLTSEKIEAVKKKFEKKGFSVMVGG